MILSSKAELSLLAIGVRLARHLRRHDRKRAAASMGIVPKALVGIEIGRVRSQPHIDRAMAYVAETRKMFLP